MVIIEKFYASHDGEEFNDGPYDTREEAAHIAPHEGYGEYAPGITFQVGKAKNIEDVVVIKGWKILEDIHDQAREEVGEMVDDWLYDVPKAEEDDLSKMLTDTLIQWMEKYGRLATFCKITDITEHTHLCQTEEECEKYLDTYPDVPVKQPPAPKPEPTVEPIVEIPEPAKEEMIPTPEVECIQEIPESDVLDDEVIADRDPNIKTE